MPFAECEVGASLPTEPKMTIRNCGGSHYVVQTKAGALYLFYVDINSDLVYKKSLDGGFSWTDTPVIVKAGTILSAAVWYDRWSGLSSDVIHICWMNTDTNDVEYDALDTASDALAGTIQVFDGASINTSNNYVSITRARGGNLYVAFDVDGGTETGFFRSTTSGASASFAARTNLNEAASTDWVLLGPGFATDNQDILAIFWDRSADQLTIKVYDDSANTWTESSAVGSMVDTAAVTYFPQMALAVDLVNSKLLLVAWSATDSANADLRFWRVDETNFTSAEGTNVVLNSGDDQALCAVTINPTGTISVIYAGKADGSEDAGVKTRLYYKQSTDNGATWSAEQALSPRARRHAALWTAPVTFTNTLYSLAWAGTTFTDGLFFYPPYPGPGVGTGQFAAGMGG
jgi:hypothetical protein